MAKKRNINVKNNSKNNAVNIFVRYIILILIAIPNIYLFYFIFTSLTIYPVFYFINFFTKATLNGTIISFGADNIEIVGACVAGSAYYLLTILNLSTPNIKIKKRILMLFISYLTFLILNIARIVFLSYLIFIDSAYFDATHKILWYSLSTLLVVIIWFSEVKFFKINSIPVYEDVKFLYRKSLFKKKR